MQHAGQAREQGLHHPRRSSTTEIARLKLRSMGIAIDALTEEQEKYLASWESGT